MLPDVSDVIDVPVSPSSVVTELCYASPCCSDWEVVESQSYSFLQKASTILYKYGGRDEVRRLTRESASDGEKKNDAAHTSAKFVRLL